MPKEWINLKDTPLEYTVLFVNQRLWQRKE